MALNKEIKNKQGIATNYHRIASFLVDKDKNNIQVLVKHYINSVYRKKEKSKIESIILRDKKYAELDNLIKLNIDGEKTEEIENLTNEINNLILNNTELLEEDNSNMFISEDIELLEFFTQNYCYSLEDIYNKLKETDKYINAKNI